MHCHNAENKASFLSAFEVNQPNKFTFLIMTMPYKHGSMLGVHYFVLGCSNPLPLLLTRLASRAEQDVGKFYSAEKGDVWLTLDGV